MYAGEAQASGPGAMLSRAMLRRPEIAVLAWFAIFASLYAAAVPAVEAPDEPFHLDYVNFLLERHELTIDLPGTKGERLTGELWYAREPRLGTPGEVVSTPLATFAYFDRQPWHVGWLSVLSAGGSPVFDDEGELTPWARDVVHRGA